MKSIPPSRGMNILPALALLAAGLAITFTQTLHQSLPFNSWVIAGFAVIYGVVTFLVSRPGRFPIAIVSILAGIAAPFATSSAQLSLVLLIWAAVIAVVELWPSVRTRYRESLVLGILAGCFAILLAVAGSELLMVVGFFACYAILAGVYLGIAAFDRPEHETQQAGQPRLVTGENGT